MSVDIIDWCEIQQFTMLDIPALYKTSNINFFLYNTADMNTALCIYGKYKYLNLLPVFNANIKTYFCTFMS